MGCIRNGKIIMNIKGLKISNLILGIVVVVLMSFFAYCSYLWYQSENYQLGGVPVLNYHQVNDESKGALTVPVKEFDRQMAYLKEHHYTTITCDDLYRYMTKGENLPDKPVLITFDDGYVDNFREALPILEKYQMKATLFMIADSVGEKRFLTKEELESMERKGFQIESHTYSHKWLVDESVEEITQEITSSRKILESIVDRPIHYLAYPGGFTNEKVEQTVNQSGIRMAFTVYPNTVKRGENILALPRLPVFAGDGSYILFIARLHLGPLAYKLARARDYARVYHMEWLVPYIPML